MLIGESALMGDNVFIGDSVLINPIPPGGGGGRGRKVPAPISTFENFLDI